MTARPLSRPSTGAPVLLLFPDPEEQSFRATFTRGLALLQEARSIEALARGPLDVLRAHRIAVAADELLRTIAPPFFSDGSLRDRRSDLTRRPCLDAYVYARGLRRRVRREAPARWGQMRRLPALARPGAVANDNAV